MIKNLLRTCLVLRLELQAVPLDWGPALLAWLRRPAIEIVLRARDQGEERRARLRRKLDEVYPF